MRMFTRCVRDGCSWAVGHKGALRMISSKVCAEDSPVDAVEVTDGGCNKGSTSSSPSCFRGSRRCDRRLPSSRFPSKPLLVKKRMDRLMASSLTVNFTVWYGYNCQLVCYRCQYLVGCYHEFVVTTTNSLVDTRSMSALSMRQCELR